MNNQTQCTLADCPPGLFRFGDGIGFKSEYGDNAGNSEAFCVESGEYFWGGTSSKADRERLMVAPFELTTLTASHERMVALGDRVLKALECSDAYFYNRVGGKESMEQPITTEFRTALSLARNLNQAAK